MRCSRSARRRSRQARSLFPRCASACRPHRRQLPSSNHQRRLLPLLPSPSSSLLRRELHLRRCPRSLSARDVSVAVRPRDLELTCLADSCWTHARSLRYLGWRARSLPTRSSSCCTAEEAQGQGASQGRAVAGVRHDDERCHGLQEHDQEAASREGLAHVQDTCR